jgi:cation diffusion facilitator CzcD-associated flavoprotein CzcO
MRTFYEGLEKAGFWLDWGDDGSGLFMKYLRRGSGYYIDVGASQLIIDGKIKLKRGQVVRLDETGVNLDDGTDLDADLVVYATGYNSMNGWVADLMGQETADTRSANAGVSAPTPPRIPGPGKASSATCGSRHRYRTCGCTAATCTSRATTRSFCRSRSRRGWRGSRHRSTGYRRSTT